jgi:polyhydroxyalkanoate synthesis repressor PhaR
VQVFYHLKKLTMNFTSQNKEIITIKKYTNRRLYNTQTSCYITLDDLFQMVQSKIDFRVVEAKTNEDITKSILVQIIFEQENKGYSVFPEEILKYVICLYGNKIPDEFNQFIQNITNNFSKDGNQRNIIEEISKQNLELFQDNLKKMYNFFGDKKNDN